MSLKSKTALAALTLIASTAAFSQTKAPEPDYTWSFNIGAVSDYRVRGITQTANQPSVQGGVDFTHKSGVYVGAWAASNLKWIKEFNGATKGDYEVDVYGGYRSEIMPGLSYDIGAITYQYPGNNSGDGSTTLTKADTYEIYGALTYKVVTLKYNQSVGDFLGVKDSNGSRYWDLSAALDLSSGFTLTPHIGVQTIPANVGNSSNNASYTDYALTLTKDFGNGFTGWVSAVGTDAKEGGFYSQTDGRFLAKGGALLGVKYTF